MRGKGKLKRRERKEERKNKVGGEEIEDKDKM